MSTIPNQLNITIRTSIPGYQKVQYKPSMTIKNIGKDDSSVKFNPLIKLQKSYNNPNLNLKPRTITKPPLKNNSSEAELLIESVKL